MPFDNPPPHVPFSPAEDRDLIEGRALGFSFPEIGELLGRPGPACGQRWRKLQTGATRNQVVVRRANRTTRACLRCRRSFKSDGAHNRLCDPCRSFAADISPFEPEPYGDRL